MEQYENQVLGSHMSMCNWVASKKYSNMQRIYSVCVSVVLTENIKFKIIMCLIYELALGLGSVSECRSTLVAPWSHGNDTNLWLGTP